MPFYTRVGDLSVYPTAASCPSAFVFDACQIAELELLHISALEFIHVDGADNCGGVSHDGVLAAKNGNSVQIYFTQNEPATPLQGAEAQGSSSPKLLVAMYAWDSNSYPGNEYAHFIRGS
jgi:hypothetical protein